MAYRLFTTYFESENPARQQEMELCLQMNVATFNHVYVRSEVENFSHTKPYGIKGFCVQRRPTYADIIKPAKTLVETLGSAEDVVVIANTDVIIPRQSLEDIDANLQEDEVYALTRWDITENGIRLFNQVHSQDVWAFRGPPKPDIGGDYYFGIPGCDNRFAHELDAAGYKVLNPAKSIRTYHLHLSGHRPGNKPENRVPGPYLFVKPHELGEEPQYSTVKKVSRRASQV